MCVEISFPWWTCHTLSVSLRLPDWLHPRPWVMLYLFLLRVAWSSPLGYTQTHTHFSNYDTLVWSNIVSCVIQCVWVGSVWWQCAMLCVNPVHTLRSSHTLSPLASINGYTLTPPIIYHPTKTYLLPSFHHYINNHPSIILHLRGPCFSCVCPCSCCSSCQGLCQSCVQVC